MQIIRYNGEYCQFLGIISDKKNFAIAVALLSSGTMTRKEIGERTGLRGASLSRRLAKLVSCGYVYKQGVEERTTYSANQETMEPLIKLLNKHIDSHKENKVRS